MARSRERSVVTIPLLTIHKTNKRFARRRFGLSHTKSASSAQAYIPPMFHAFSGYHRDRSHFGLMQLAWRLILPGTSDCGSLMLIDCEQGDQKAQCLWYNRSLRVKKYARNFGIDGSKEWLGRWVDDRMPSAYCQIEDDNVIATSTQQIRMTFACSFPTSGWTLCAIIGVNAIAPWKGCQAFTVGQSCSERVACRPTKNLRFTSPDERARRTLLKTSYGYQLL